MTLGILSCHRVFPGYTGVPRVKPGKSFRAKRGTRTGAVGGEVLGARSLGEGVSQTW